MVSNELQFRRLPLNDGPKEGNQKKIKVQVVEIHNARICMIQTCACADKYMGVYVCVRVQRFYTLNYLPCWQRRKIYNGDYLHG